MDRSKRGHQMCRRFVASRNGETYRILRRFPLAVMFALAGCALLQGCERSEEQHIVAELDRLSQGNGPGKYFAGFDYVCFDYITGGPEKSSPQWRRRNQFQLRNPSLSVVWAVPAAT